MDFGAFSIFVFLIGLALFSVYKHIHIAQTGDIRVILDLLHSVSIFTYSFLAGLVILALDGLWRLTSLIFRQGKKIDMKSKNDGKIEKDSDKSKDEKVEDKDESRT